MVKKYWLWILFFFMPFYTFCDDVKISTEVDPYSYAGTPLSGTITITHQKQESIDEKSFIMEGKPLPVVFVKEVQFSPTSPLVLSIYSFSLPSQQAGLQILPAISGVIGKKKYSSYPTTYAVGDTPSPSQVSNPVSQADAQQGERIPIILTLENIVEGDAILYPGQHITVGYRFQFNFNVDLNKEDLPLIKGEGFEKVGGKETNAFMKGDMNILEVKQILEANKPGTYNFPHGVIQGRAYRNNNGQRETAPSDSSALSQPVVLQVLPFPEKNRPTSFNGAIGTFFNFTVVSLSPNAVDVGDKIQLLITIKGKGELSQLSMPAVCCQPGFSGFFGMSDLPPIEKLNEDTKTFTVELRPLSTSIKQIPSLEFSYFNPKEKAYKVIKSQPIPLVVRPLRENSGQIAPKNQKAEIKSNIDKSNPQVSQPEAIEIGSVYALSTENLENRIFGNGWVLLVIPIGAAFIFFQIQMKNSLIKEMSTIKIQTSQDLFNQAMNLAQDSSEFFNLVQKAFLLRLVERGEIPSENISPDFLSAAGEPGKVRALMREIEEKRFAAVGGAFDEKFIMKIRRLFEELKP